MKEAIQLEIAHVTKNEENHYNGLSDASGLRKKAALLTSMYPEDFPFCYSSVSPGDSRVVDLAFNGDPYE